MPFKTILFLLLVSSALAAQAPTTLHYQGRLLENTADQDAVGGTVDIDFSIWTEATGGTELWTESWTGVTLTNGIFSVLLGSNGSALDPADFQGDSSLFLQLVIDGETLSPRQQLGSVPFAMVDEPANEIQDPTLIADALGLTGSTTSVDLSGYLDNTDAQTLSLAGNTLSISGSGSSVDLASTSDVVTLIDLLPARLVFATSRTYTGDLGGLAGADAECQLRADAAGLSGNYLAWMSDQTDSPSTRFDRLGSFELVDGTRIADDWAGLTDGTLQNPIDKTETGGNTFATFAWTGTEADGTPHADTCAGWTSAASSVKGRLGKADQVDDDWSSVTGVGCNVSHRLYCFQQLTSLGVDNQQLTLDGNTIQLTADSGTQTVDLSPYLDDTTVDDQVLSLSGDTLRLTSDDGDDTVDLSPYLDDTDTTVDNQVLSLSGDTLRLTSDDGDDTVDLSPYLDDTDTTIDNQVLSRSGNSLRLTSDDGTDTVDLSPYLDDTTTDNQQLSLTGDTIQLTSDDGVDTVDLATATTIAEILSRLDSLEERQNRLVFISSETYTGALGGLSGADDKCTKLANAAGFDGEFMAWLSDDTESPSNRFDQTDRRFEMVDGTLIATDWADLTDNSLRSRISLDEMGDDHLNEVIRLAWTGSFAAGTAASPNCDSWTSSSSSSEGVAGFFTETAQEWSRGTFGACNSSYRLYCFEQ